MKKITFTLCSALALLPAITLAAAPTAFETAVPVDHIYTPSGFDSNDNTEVVVTGYLPNLCYKAPNSVISVKDGKISVSVKAMRRDNGLAFCTLIRLPFTESVNIGVLDKGQYQIAVNEKTNWEQQSKIAVTEAVSNSVDEVVYANVDKVERLSDDSRTVVLTGYNPSDCFELKEIVVKDNGSDTYSVLPKMKKVRDFCPKKMIPFNYKFQVPETLAADKVLLHVRVMDGRSVNAFFNNKPELE
jgi:hypothetical protein